MKNELKILEDFFSNPQDLQLFSDQYISELVNKLNIVILPEIRRVSESIEEEIVSIIEPKALKLYISKYIIRIGNLLQKIEVFNDICVKNVDFKEEHYALLCGDTETEEEFDQNQEKITNLLKDDYFIIEGLDICIDIMTKCLSKIVSDNNFLFDSLDADDLCNIIIDDYRKNQPETKSPLILNTIPAKPMKLKTNLTVPQLAMLCRMLSGLKPKIFNIKADIDLHRFIKSNFETKNSSEDGISIENFRQDFSKPKPSTADFWETHLRTMIAQVVKIQKN